MQIEIRDLDRRHQRLRIAEPTRLARLVASLAQHGQQTPVLVIAATAPHRFVLIEGYARVAALLELAHDTVEALVLPLAEPEALVLAHRIETARVQTALEDGWLLAELVATHGLAPRELAVRLGRSPSWISRRLALVDVLPHDVQDAIRLGRMPAHAAMRTLVPLARANAEQCARLVEALGREPVTVRQMDRLYTAWRDGDPVQRERIAAHPRLFLKADDARAAPVAPPAEIPVDPLIAELEALAGLSRRIRRRMRTVAPRTEPAVDLLRAAEEARLAFAALDPLLPRLASPCSISTPARPS